MGRSGGVYGLAWDPGGLRQVAIFGQELEGPVCDGW